jgi:hypothetical protein
VVYQLLLVAYRPFLLVVYQLLLVVYRPPTPTLTRRLWHEPFFVAFSGITRIPDLSTLGHVVVILRSRKRTTPLLTTIMWTARCALI